VVDNGPYYDVFVKARETVFQAFTTKSTAMEMPLAGGAEVFLHMKRSRFHVF
jgi:hypothetical protein